MEPIEKLADDYAQMVKSSMEADGVDMTGKVAGICLRMVRESFIHGMERMREEMIRWHDIGTDKDGFATSESLDAIFDKIPCLVKDSRSGEIELIDYDNAPEWRGDIERKPSRYRWRGIHE